MTDEVEQSAPVEAALAPEAPASVEAPAAPEIPTVEPTPEPVAADQTPTTPLDAAVPSVESSSEVQVAEIAEPIVSEPIATEPPTEPAATPSQPPPTPAPQPSSPTQSSPPTHAQQSVPILLPPDDLVLRGLAARRARREAKLQKVLELVKKEGPLGSIDVQKHLHVSDSTATRYLKELVRQGKLKRVGSPSRARYEIAG